MSCVVDFGDNGLFPSGNTTIIMLHKTQAIQSEDVKYELKERANMCNWVIF